MSFARNLLAAFIFVLVIPARAQVATGQYAFGTFDSLGPEAINVGNLNVMLTVPVLHKAGRAGTNFTYDLNYNSSIWTPLAGAWVPDQNWGWLGQTEALTGYLSNITTAGTCSNHGPHFYNQIRQVAYYDAAGIAHRFHGSVRDSEGACSGDVDTLSNTWSTDRKYKLGAYSDGFPLTDVRGNLINAPVGSITGAGTYTDTNGNEISTDGSGNFTDTTGSTALAITGSAPSNQVFAYVDAAGTNRSVTVSYVTHSVATNFGCTGVSEYSGSSISLIDTITLPDSSTYHFTYESTPGVLGSVTGRIATITLPSGGVITYAYSGANNDINCADGSTLGFTRTMTSLSTAPSRTYTRTVSGATSHTTVVDAVGNHADYDFVTGYNPSDAVTETYQTLLSVTTGGTGTPPLSQQTCYNASATPCTTTSISFPITQVDQYKTWDGTTQSGSQQIYDSYGELTGNTTYDFGSSTSRGSLLQAESMTFSAGLLTSDGLADSSRAIRATNYTYDGSTPHATSGIPQRNTSIGSSGNLTEVDQYLVPGNTSAGKVSHVFEYYDTGSLYADHTVQGGVTHYSYDSTNTFPTTITPADPNSVGLSTSLTYDPYQGTAVTSTNANGTVSTVSAQDAYGRPGQIQVASGSTTLAKSTFSYSPTEISSTSYQSSSVSGQTNTYFDPYGRSIRSATQNGSGSWYVSDTCYDGNGRVSFKSYPYSVSTLGSQVCSGGGDTYTYDALGRTLSISHADAASTSTSFSYLGNATKKVDENGVTHVYQVDGLGRPAITCEVSSSTLNGVSPVSCGTAITATGFITSYTYSGNTTTVTQGAQTRSFMYDGLGRLAYKTEPESPGSPSYYTYSSNSTGQVVVHTKQMANQTNPSTYTNATTQYDALGRPVSTTYDDSITPTKIFTYDIAPSGSSFSVGYAKGMMTSAYVGAGSTLARTMFSYDALGRVQQTDQCVPGWCGTSTLDMIRSYGYDWSSNKVTESYSTPSGTVGLTYGFNLAGQLTSVSGGQDTSLSSLYAASPASPFGPASATLGNGVTAALGYDVFGRQTGMALTHSSTSLYSYSATWLGQRVTASADTVNASSAAYSYDDMNRLNAASMSTPYGSLNLSWSYDRYGNRLSQSGTGTYSGTLNQPTLVPDVTSNRITSSGYAYDAAGNLTGAGGTGYTYDAEGNVTAISGAMTASYTYDALNQRVLATVNGTTQAYGFNTSGQRATVWNSSGGLVSAQYYAGSQPLAYYLASDGHVRFQHQDWTGTERLRTTSTGTVDASFTSLPFGDSLTTASGSDTDAYHYAGQDSDSQDLQHASFRELSTIQGRWLRPDPYDGSYVLTDPQSLNRYAYVGNSPMSFADSTGLSKTRTCLSISNCGSGGGDELGGGFAILTGQGYAWGSQWDEFEAQAYMFASWGHYELKVACSQYNDCDGNSNDYVWRWNSNSLNAAIFGPASPGPYEIAMGTQNGAPNNGMTPQQLAADDKRIKGCEAQASAASTQQPSMAPNGNSLLTGMFNAGATLYRTEKLMSGVVGFIQGLIVRPVVNGVTKEAAYSATLNACLNPGSYMNGVGMVW